MQFIDPNTDPWHAAADAAEAPATQPLPQRHTVYTLAQWQALRPTLRGPQPALGVRLANTDDEAALLPDLDRLALIELEFPAWTDGRAYSQARTLRLRHAWRGALRARGQVLVDMLPLLHRTGFDQVVLAEGQDPAEAERALSLGLTAFGAALYQADVWQRSPAHARGRDLAGPSPAALAAEASASGARGVPVAPRAAEETA